MSKSNSDNYYLSNKKRMVNEFKKMYRGVRKSLESNFDKESLDRLERLSEGEYINLLSRLPYLGGDENDHTINFVTGAIALSIIIPLEKEGFTREQIGKVIYDSFYNYFQSIPSILRMIIGFIATSKFFIRRMIKQIEESAQKKYKDDFVLELVESDGRQFDFGYNYKECAIHKLYTKYNKEHYLKYVCLGDFAMFKSYGIGFSRTKTIGNGAAVCDFRFTKKGKTPDGWPPENLTEWKKDQ